MNVVFAGYREWSFAILKKLLKQQMPDCKITGIITTPEAEKKFSSLGVTTFVYKPFANQKKMLLFLKKCNTQICLFYGWSWIIPEEIYNSYLSLILHPSPLPRYRGGSPLQHQIISGEKESAVTILEVGDKIDAGDIYSQTPFSLDGSLEEIFEKIISIGTNDTKKVLELVIKKSITPIKQDENKATYFKRRNPKESEITLKDLQTKTSKELYDFIRSLADPYPNAFIKCGDGKKLLIENVRIES